MITDLQGIIKTITREIKQLMDIAVVGMSGGADSTLVALLCQQALGPERVYSLHLPANRFDEETFNRNSQEVARALAIHRLVIPISPISDAIINTCRTALDGAEFSRLNRGNARARARMCVLYTFSHHLEQSLGGRARVVGTGNLSEDFIGYDTKGGDALADIFPIGDLFKSEVYQLLDYYVEQGVITAAMVNRIPSAGLWPEQTDEAELGYSYNDMEAPIRAYLAGSLRLDSDPTELQPVERFVLERHRAHAHKHQAAPVIAVRSFCK